MGRAHVKRTDPDLLSDALAPTGSSKRGRLGSYLLVVNVEVGVAAKSQVDLLLHNDGTARRHLISAVQSRLGDASIHVGILGVTAAVPEESSAASESSSDPIDASF